MAIDRDYLLALPPRAIPATHTRRDSILYALGVGAGQDATAQDTLKYVYEEGLTTLPTMATVLAYPGFWQREPQYGIDWQRILHAEQSVEFLAPLPVEGDLVGEMTIDWIVDKGAAKGALLCASRKIRDRASGALLAIVRQTSFLRGDGGCGSSRDEAPAPHPVPSTEPDDIVVLETRPEQALLYRLSGDLNPIHADPRVAQEAGLPRPILHGLCSYGMAGYALVRTVAANRPERLRRMDCRFSAPVFPGETLVVSIWREAPGRAAFQAQVRQRGVIVLTNGYAEFDI